MSGPAAGQALHNRFDAIRRAELARLKKKLAGLSEADRQFVDQITAEIVRALTRGPEQALADDASALSAEALIHLFALEA